MLLLERGNFLPREIENWDADEVFVDGRYMSTETWYDADGKPFQPQVHYFVGGATKLYGAALYRLRPQDFGELKHVDGISPAWPLSYDDFEPFYTKAEWLYQVHGNHGEDPTEGPWSKQYPFPAVSHEPRIQEISRCPGEQGLSPVPCAERRAATTKPTGNRVRASGASTCDGFPCLVHAKADADTIAVRPLLGRPERHAPRRRRSDEARDRRDRPHGHRGRHVMRGRRAGAVRGRHRRGFGRRREQRGLAAALGERLPPEWSRERLGPGRPQLHVPQQQGGRRAVEGTERHGLPEDARR